MGFIVAENSSKRNYQRITKLDRGVVFTAPCESDRNEHEEFFSRKISVRCKNNAEKEFRNSNYIVLNTKAKKFICFWRVQNTPDKSGVFEYDRPIRRTKGGDEIETTSDRLVFQSLNSHVCRWQANYTITVGEVEIVNARTC